MVIRNGHNDRSQPEDTPISSKPYSEALLLELVRSLILSVAAVFPRGEVPSPPIGYFTLRSAKDGRVLLVSEIGDTLAEKREAWLFNSQEKGKRLFENPNDLSSWESRDPDHPTQKKWGGAIRTPDYILSFSGLPELADEALCAIVALKMLWINSGQAYEIFATSRNGVAADLID